MIVDMDSEETTNQETLLRHADRIGRISDVMLAFTLEDQVLPPSRVPQVAFGLCRAAFSQSKIIALLAKENLLSSAAPNQRLFLEAALRLSWLADLSVPNRSKAVESMLSKDRKDLNATLDYLDEHEFKIDFDPTEMNEFELNAPDKGSLQEQAKKLRQAVDATELKVWVLYSMWRRETEHAHASAFLAGSYAPTYDQIHMSLGQPEMTDPDLKIDGYIQLLIALKTSDLLHDERMDTNLTNIFLKEYLSEWSSS